MRAVLVDHQPQPHPQIRLVDDYVEPVPLPGEARIRTVLAGICNTDLEILHGYAGFGGVLGHEFVGTVIQAEDSALVGQRVVGEINASCGVCPTCHAGRQTHCPSRTALGIRGRDGVLADYFCLPVRNLHPVPAALSNTEALFTEPLAAACEILEQIHVRPTDRVVVLGDGKLGLLIAQVLALTGCDLTVIGHHPEKLAILTTRGIHTRLGDEGLAGGFDLVVDCTGRAEGFETARSIVRPRGTLVLKSTHPGHVQIDLSQIVVDEVRVVGSRCGPFAAALRLLVQDLVDVGSLVEAEYTLDQALAAFEHAGRQGALKVLVRP